jgi:hypothetical protein
MGDLTVFGRTNPYYVHNGLLMIKKSKNQPPGVISDGGRGESRRSWQSSSGTWLGWPPASKPQPAGR